MKKRWFQDHSARWLIYETSTPPPPPPPPPLPPPPAITIDRYSEHFVGCSFIEAFLCIAILFLIINIHVN